MRLSFRRTRRSRSVYAPVLGWRMRVVRGLRRGFSLIELLITISIILLVAGLIGGAAMVLLDESKEVETKSMLNSMHMSMRIMREDVSVPFPDEQQSTVPSDPGYFIGSLGYWPDESDLSDRGIAYHLDNQYGFSFSATRDVDDDGLLIDRWNQPLIYVLGDAENREINPGYDDSKTQDLNKPRYVDKSIIIDGEEFREYNDWNRRDEAAYPYIYSLGEEGDPNAEENWLYVQD